MWFARWVSNTVDCEKSGPRMTMGTSTAAGAGSRAEKEVSRSTSGCQTGGCSKRARRASGNKWADGTAGISWSMRQTGTLRGSKDKGLDTESIYNRDRDRRHLEWPTLYLLAALFFIDIG
jgi:hypothetical protein